jgi:hypothetical protein
MFQVLSIFAQANINWPSQLTTLFTIFSAFSFNLDLTAPECAAKSITWPLKWAFIELLPGFVLVSQFSIYGAVYLYKVCCLNTRKSGARHGHLPRECVLMYAAKHASHKYSAAHRSSHFGGHRDVSCPLHLPYSHG